MPLHNIGARVRHTFAFRFVSKFVCSLIMISMLAVSMPAAPRMIVDGAPKFPQVLSSINSSLQTIDLLSYSSNFSFPTVDKKPVLGVFQNAVAFAGDLQSLVLPSVPSGLESAKLPTFGERTFAFFSPLLAFLKPSAVPVTTTAAPPQPTSVVDFDFDNDGKADIGRWRVASTDFKIRNSSSGTVSDPYVLPAASKITPGDFNGDGKTDAGVFNNGTWTYKTSPSATAQTISFGTTGDIPVAGDYDGDGTTDAAVFRPSTNTWWIKKSSNGSSTSTLFGSTGDITIPGDYDGDGKNDLALFRPSTGDWHVTGSTVGYFKIHWGLGTDTPVPADFDGDGKTDPAVFRPSTGTWYA
ncbi:MAG TPA: VCBS repeat-containing protein, partial [Pyrinomonadaceae bacterium]|nr:VCBS repeat-containing protein [Pyrinomonadaceae bacterium]